MRVTHYCVVEKMNLLQKPLYMKHRGNISEVNALEFKENLEEMFPRYQLVGYYS